MTMREDDFNAALMRAPSQRPHALASLHDGASREVRWPQGGGHIQRLRTMPWEGASALYFDFRLNDDLRVQLEPHGELLLTFFLAGRVSGQVGNEHGRRLDFGVDRALLRTPNRNGGYLIHIPGACSNRFVQFRLRRELMPHWLHALDVRLTMRQMRELIELDDGRVLCNAVLTPRVRACLERVRNEPSDQPGFVPLFHAQATELLTCVLLDLGELLKPVRSPKSVDPESSCLVEKVRALWTGAPGHAWTVHELAQRANCSASRLQQAFHQATGSPVHAFLSARRLELAAYLLRETRLGVHAIALETGWESHSRFTATFRVRHGMTPRDYRLRHGASSQLV